MGRRPTVLLFDIDGTLLLTGGAGRRAFERAFATMTGRGDACAGFSFGGMTDRAIAREGLLALGRAVEEALVERLFEHYLDALREELLRTQNYTVMPGVRELLAALSPHRHLALGLGTGNLRRGAEAKLRHGQLWDPFTFGGFGCDHEQRGELLRRGAERGAERLRSALDDCRVVVIGDTARDVAAAQQIGAECVAVETGGVAADALRKAGSCTVFRDLRQPGVLEHLVG
jgi:phosphoglycolate phosphatase